MASAGTRVSGAECPKVERTRLLSVRVRPEGEVHVGDERLVASEKDGCGALLAKEAD